MPIRDTILPEFDQETSNTRKTLERVPDDKLDWRPHPKSPSLGWLASHLVDMLKWTGVTLNQPEFNVAADRSHAPFAAKSREELLTEFDKNVVSARETIAGISDEALGQMWTMRRDDHVMFSMPRMAVLRSFILNHSIHHRAQLGVYLRLNDVPLPATYGPSADEGSM